MENSKISTILKRLLFEKNLRAVQLAKQVNLPQQTIQRLVAGMTPKPHLKTLIPIAEYFSITVEQLKGTKPLEEFRDYAAENKIKEIPFYSWKLENLNADKIITDATISANAYALQVENHSLEPRFAKQTVFIVDPKKAYKNRDFVIVKMQKQAEASLQQLIIDGQNIYFKSLVTELASFPPTQMQAHDKICGVVVQARIDFED